MRLRLKHNISIAFILLLTPHLSSQTFVCNTANSIADSSLSKYEQAQQLYDWITMHIKYDVKSLTTYNPNETDINVILRKQKGVCYEYALVFKEFCDCRDIPSEIVLGYAKGYGFYSGKNYVRAVHAWNILKPDSVWLLADPTWGSGYIYRKKRLLKVIKGIFTNKPAIHDKLKFRREPDRFYFNVHPDSTTKTHLPLNPIFQLKEYGTSYQAFIVDSLSDNFPIINPIKKLNARNHFTLVSYYADDAETGHLLNPLNNYDFANAKLAQAAFLGQSISENPGPDQKENLKNIALLTSKSLESITRQNLIIDSLYKTRKKQLSDNIKITKKLDGRVIKDKTRFAGLTKRKKVQQAISRISKTQNKKSALEDKIEKLNRLGFAEVSIEEWEPDTIKIEGYRKKTIPVMQAVDSMIEISSRSLQYLDTLTSFYQSINDSLSGSRSDYLAYLGSGDSIVRLINDKLISDQLLLLNNGYSRLQELYKNRAAVFAEFNDRYNSDLKFFGEIEKRGKESVKVLRDSYFNTYDVYHVEQLDTLKNRLYDAYLSNIALIDSYINFRKLDLDNKINDKSQIREIKKLIRHDLKIYGTYFEYAQELNDADKKREKYYALMVRNQAKSANSLAVKQLKLISTPEN